MSHNNMSHTVTITRTTTTSTSAVILNTGYFKTWPGILKFFELVLGIAAVATAGYFFNGDFYKYVKDEQSVKIADIFFLLIITTFMIGTFLIFLSCLISLSTASVLSKTIYETIYHGFAFVLCLIAGLVLIIEVSNNNNKYTKQDRDGFLAASILGLILAVLYLASTIFAVRSYRGL